MQWTGITHTHIYLPFQRESLHLNGVDPRGEWREGDFRSGHVCGAVFIMTLSLGQCVSFFSSSSFRLAYWNNHLTLDTTWGAVDRSRFAGMNLHLVFTPVWFPNYH